MTTATEIIAFLLPRRPRPIVEKTTGLPHGWGIWLRNAPQRHGRLTYEPIDALIAELALRPRPTPARVVPMTRWRALRSLLWQHWDPPPREERGTRWLGGLGSLLLHLGFLVLLLLVSLITMPRPAEEADGTRVQLTLIGRGTQGEGGGAGPQTPETGAQAAAPATASKATSQPRRATAASTTPDAPTAEPAEAQPAPATPPPQPEVAAQPAPAEPQPRPEPPQPAPAEQPLQVTETPQPTQDFVLPPVTPPQIQLRVPQIQMPQTAARVREVEIVQDQQPVAVQQVAPRPMDAPVVPQAQVRQREIPMPAPEVTVQAPALRPMRATAAATVQLQGSQPTQARIREIPTPDAPAEAQASARAPESPASQSTSSSAQPAAAQAEQGRAAQNSSNTASTGAPPSPISGGNTAGSIANTPGAGASPSDRLGTPGPKTADDWGASSQVTPGNQAGAGEGLKGLFNADGSAKLPGDTAGGRTVKPGVPGSRQQARIDADRAGKWLERPAFGYEPTMFDKYWIPGGSLLQDWVQAGISEMEIPIPGTSKRIKCVVSVLQAGGACGLFDPNMNEQPATARPPPEIPVKRTPIPEGS
ncbi:hypothetical protein [Pseudoxanthomonas sp.]|uniref:hypothetical protein n=1 Tax=Pseudoxanthomonas sp. TaxID=1871049 RepID=UPI0026230D49|nr:hypothetical protein [Pseudoxanthomonas sp.]WDS37066.1 MAG: hypothetical protein O8I58_03955 [Pseudoxanthomonas sp.]